MVFLNNINCEKLSMMVLGFEIQELVLLIFSTFKLVIISIILSALVGRPIFMPLELCRNLGNTDKCKDKLEKLKYLLFLVTIGRQ